MRTKLMPWKMAQARKKIVELVTSPIQSCASACVSFWDTWSEVMYPQGSSSMKPTIITITGPSCAGKSTLEKLLVNRKVAVNAVSTTTRPMRDGDISGQSYYFVTRQEFEDGIYRNDFIETVEFGSNYYGMSKAEIERVSVAGLPVVIVCEPIGQKQIAKFCETHGWKLVSVFVSNPEEVIADRFLQRFQKEVRFQTPGIVIDKEKKRLSEMMTTERRWVDEALDKEIYDLAFWRFDQYTEDFAVMKIKELL